MTTVVVIDDDKDTVSLMSELLEVHGMNVVGKGSNGLEGVKLFDKFQPDLILLDLMMPQYDGLFALKAIRKKDPMANVIIITGDIPKSLIDEIQSFNPTKIIFKPVDVNILVESFLLESNENITYLVKYKFQEDTKFHTCTQTYEQFKSFRNLPIVNVCRIIKKNVKNSEDQKHEMQKALNLAAKNDISGIQKLSELIK